MKKIEFEAHKPSKFIAGIYLHQKDEWKGKFEATADELVQYGLDAELTDQEFAIVTMMIDAQQFYEQWWNKVKGL